MPSFISEVHGQRYAHKHVGEALSWCFKKLSQRLWCFHSTHLYNLKITVCSHSGTRILEKVLIFLFSAILPMSFSKIFKTMLMSFLIKDWSVLMSGFVLPQDFKKFSCNGSALLIPRNLGLENIYLWTKNNAGIGSQSSTLEKSFRCASIDSQTHQGELINLFFCTLIDTVFRIIAWNMRNSSS